MSFSGFELASYASAPVSLFEFHRGPVVYRYNGADSNLTVGGEVYAAKPLSFGEIRLSGETQTDELTITAPASLALVEDFTNVPPQQRVRAIIKRYHVGAEPVVRWSGFVDRINRTSAAKVSVICKSLLGGLQQNGARLIWQRQCPHVIYGPGCKVSKSTHAVSAVVETLAGNMVTSAGFMAAGEGRLRGGFLEWTTSRGFQAWRAISDHGGDQISLLGGVRGLQVGSTVVAYPGCPRTPDGCESFNNGSRYGGFRHLPGKSPFDGNPVF